MIDKSVLSVEITTSDGATTKHSYELEGSDLEVVRLVSEVTNRVANAVAGHTSHLLMENPVVVYRSEHILRATFQALGREELLANLKEPMGFRTEQ